MNIFTLMAKVGLDTTAFKDGVETVQSGADRLKSGLEKGSGLDEFAGKLNAGGKALTSIGKVLAPFSALAAGALGGAYKSSLDFADGVAKVSTLVDLAEHPLEELSDLMLELASTTGRSTAEINESAYQALSASVSYENLGQFIKTATDLSKAGFTDTATAVDGLTTIINAYGREAKDAEQIANQLVMTQNKGKTEIGELSGVLGRVIPTAAGAKVSFDNVATAMASLTGQGIQTNQAGTYLNAMLNELADSGSTVGKIIKTETGLSFQELMENGSTLGDVLEIVKGKAEETGTNFNELWGQSTANSAAMAILNSDFADFNTLMTEITGNTTALSEGVEKTNTASRKMSETLNRVKIAGVQLGTAFGEQVAPVLDKVAGGISAVTTWFSNLDDRQKKVITTILLVVAAIAPLALGLGGLLTTIASVITAVGIIGPLVAGLSLPIGSIVLAIGGVIAVIAFLATNWEYLKQLGAEFKTNMVASWKEIQRRTAEAGDKIKSTLDQITSPIKGVADKFQSGFASIQKFMEDPIGNAKKFIDEAISDIKGFFPLKIGKIFDNIKLPTFSVTGSPPFGLGGKGTAPKIDVKWNAIAEDNPYMFTRATLFGAGERRDEILYGRENLMRDIRQASAGAGIDYEEFAEVFIRVLEKAGFAFRVGEREFARLVRKAATT